MLRAIDIIEEKFEGIIYQENDLWFFWNIAKKGLTLNDIAPKTKKILLTNLLFCERCFSFKVK